MSSGPNSPKNLNAAFVLHISRDARVFGDPDPIARAYPAVIVGGVIAGPRQG